MNQISYLTYLFSDNDNDNNDGRLMSGDFYIENSLLEDELSIDTISFTVRTEVSLSSFNYGTEVIYTKNNVRFGKYYLKSIERLNQYEYTFSCQSAIGLLNDTNHYGNIYNGEFADVIIADIIGDKITYSCAPIFQEIKLYGWLPIDTRRNNLQQVLFATGGSVQKDANGDVYIATLNNTVPSVIPTNRVYGYGSLTNEVKASKIELTEHSYSILATAAAEEIFNGEVAAKSFITPLGYSVTNAGMVVFDEPVYDLTFEGCTLLNNESNCNYAIVSSSQGSEDHKAVVKGKKYQHSTNIVQLSSIGYVGEEKVAKIDTATLVSARNSQSIAERVLAYYANPSRLDGEIVLQGEKPTDTITLPNQFGSTSTGLIKSISGSFSKSVSKGEIEMRVGYNPPTVYGSRELVSIAITTQPTKTAYSVGEYFQKDGMVVVATYDDDTQSTVQHNISFTPNRPLRLSDTSVTITYTEYNVTKTATVNIVVREKLNSIYMSTWPTKTSGYNVGDTINLSGASFTAVYDSGNTATIPLSSVSFSPSTIQSNSRQDVTITYVENNIVKTTKFTIIVGSSLYATITATTTKDTYKVGELVDASKIRVNATVGGTTYQNVGFTVKYPLRVLQSGDTYITVAVKIGSLESTANIAITVKAPIILQVVRQPYKTVYSDGEYFDATGLQLRAVYADSTYDEIDNYTYSPSGALDWGTTSINLIYTVSNITLYTTVSIICNYRTYDFTDSIMLDTAGTYNLSGIGATHKNIRVICIGGGAGGPHGNNGGDGEWPQYDVSSNYFKTSTRAAAGRGGAPTAGGQGGRIFYSDIILPTLATDFTISIGSGGIGGTQSTQPQEGGASTFTYGTTTFSSANGSSSETGYTDIISGSVYATTGATGLGAADGGTQDNTISTPTRQSNQWQTRTSSGGDDRGGSFNGYNGGLNTHTGVVGDYTIAGDSIYAWSGASGGGGAAYGVAGGNGNNGHTPNTLVNQWTRVVDCVAGGNGGSPTAVPAAATGVGVGGTGGYAGGGAGASGMAQSFDGIVGGDAHQIAFYVGSGGRGGQGGTGSAGGVLILFS